MQEFIQKISHFLEEGKQILLGFMSGIILSVCILTGTNYMSASLDSSTSHTNIIAPIQVTPIISNEAEINQSEEENNIELHSASLIISDEVTISEFIAVNDLGIEFISIGQGTLLKGKAEGDSVILITTKAGTECRAQTNSNGNFGCMFATEKLSEDNIQAVYE